MLKSNKKSMLQLKYVCHKNAVGWNLSDERSNAKSVGDESVVGYDKTLSNLFLKELVEFNWGYVPILLQLFDLVVTIKY